MIKQVIIKKFQYLHLLDMCWMLPSTSELYMIVINHTAPPINNIQIIKRFSDLYYNRKLKKIQKFIFMLLSLFMMYFAYIFVVYAF
jgi:hypothetical protein